MHLIATRLWEGAQVIAAAVPGRKIYALSIAECLRMAREWLPEVVILSAFTEAGEGRAMDSIPDLIALRRGVHVVYIAKGAPATEMRRALELGAFGTVDVAVPGWGFRLGQIIEASSRHRRVRRASAVVAQAVDLH